MTQNGLGHVAEGQKIRLRDYQVDIVNKFIEHLNAYKRSSPGAGKTIITATLSSLVEQYGRTIVIANPNKDLVRQTFEDYEKLWSRCWCVFW